MSQRILVVDDEEHLRRHLVDYLEDRGFETIEASNGRQCLAALRETPPDLILLDLSMPEMDGLTMLHEVQGLTQKLPIVVVSGANTVDTAMTCIRLGAWDYLTKPIQDLSVVDLVIDRVLERSRLLQENERYRNHLEDMVRQRTAELSALNEEILATQREVVLTLGEVVENRSHDTAFHTRRVAEYSVLLARAYGMKEDDILTLRIASPLHDVGKIGIPDAILHKPGPLTPEEFAIMSQHTRIGYDILRHSGRIILRLASTIALQHHEHWDGSGYPQGLRGEAIDINARITTLADVFDALMNEREYKSAWPVERVQDYFVRERARIFDPTLTDLFLAMMPELLAVMERFPNVLIRRENHG